MFNLTKSLSTDFPYGLTHHHLTREIVNAGVTGCKEVYQNGDTITISFESDYTPSLSTINSVITEYRPVPAYFDDLKFNTINSTNSPYQLTNKSVKCDSTSGDITVIMPKTQRAKNGIFAVQKVSPIGVITILPIGLDTINNGASVQLSDNKSYIVLKASGSNWTTVLGGSVDTTANDAITMVSTAGDILVDNGSELAPLNVGTDGSVLIADSARPLKMRWGNIVGGSSICTEISATTNTSTTSSAYVQMSGMTANPSAGTYLVLFSAVGTPSQSSAICSYAIYVDGTVVPASERTFRSSTSTSAVLYTQAKITTDGQSVEVRYKTTSGTFTVGVRNIELISIQ